MNAAAIARAVVSKVGADNGASGSKSGGTPSGTPSGTPRGITLGHVAAMERFQEATSDRKPTEAAAALKDFFNLCYAEEEAGEGE